MSKFIVFIEDDDDYQYLLKRACKKIALIEKINFIKNGFEGINLIKNILKNQKTLPHYIFVDINKPMMDGLEFIEDFKKLKDKFQERLNCTIVALSASEEISHRNKIMATGVVSKIISRPEDVMLIQKTIAKELRSL